MLFRELSFFGEIGHQEAHTLPSAVTTGFQLGPEWNLAAGKSVFICKALNRNLGSERLRGMPKVTQ